MIGHIQHISVSNENDNMVLVDHQVVYGREYTLKFRKNLYFLIERYYKLYPNNFQIFCYIYFWQYIIINNCSMNHATSRIHICSLMYKLIQNEQIYNSISIIFET